MDKDSQLYCGRTILSAKLRLQQIHQKQMELLNNLSTTVFPSVFPRTEIDRARDITMHAVNHTIKLQEATFAMEQKAVVNMISSLESNPAVKYINTYGVPESIMHAINKIKNKSQLKGGKVARYARKFGKSAKLWTNLSPTHKKNLTNMGKSIRLRAGGKLQHGDLCTPGECDKDKNLVCSKKTSRCVKRGEKVVTSQEQTQYVTVREQNETNDFAMRTTALLVVFFVCLIAFIFQDDPSSFIDIIDRVSMRKTQDFALMRQAEVYGDLAEGFFYYGKTAAGIYGAISVVSAYATGGVSLGIQGMLTSAGLAAPLMATDNISENVQDTLNAYNQVNMDSGRVLFMVNLAILMTRTIYYGTKLLKNPRTVTKGEIASLAVSLPAPWLATMESFKTSTADMMGLALNAATVGANLLSFGANAINNSESTNNLMRRYQKKPLKSPTQETIADAASQSSNGRPLLTDSPLAETEDSPKLMLADKTEEVISKKAKIYNETANYEVDDLIYDEDGDMKYLWQVSSVSGSENKMEETNIKKTKRKIYVRKNEDGLFERACARNDDDRCIFSKTSEHDSSCRFVNSKCTKN